MLNYIFEFINRPKNKELGALLKLLEKLINYIKKCCKISNISKEEFITTLLITRLSYICSSPEIILNYIKNKDEFFEDLKEGANNFYKHKIIKRITSKGGT